MALVIGKLCFGKDDFQFGLELCLARAGREAHSVTEQTAQACDVLLVTVFWYRDAYALELFLRRSGIKGASKPYVLIGGMQATLCPELFAELGDVVFVGDADDHLGGILDQLERGEDPVSPHLYRSGDSMVPKPAECSPTAFCVRKGGRRDVARIEIARGCRFKCAFCALSGLKPYREVPFEALRETIISTHPSPCSCFAPERLYHSEWSKIEELLESTGRRDIGQDVRLEHLPRAPGAMVTTGVEGLSAKLRKSIGKPMAQDKLLGLIGEFVRTRKNIARLSAYFMADLPGEDDSDWTEFEGLLEAVEREEWSRWLVLQPVLNPLSPKRYTPLQDAEIHPFRDYSGRWQSMLRRGGGKWGFRVVETLVWGPLERVMDVLVERGLADAYRVISRMPDRVLSGKPRSEERGPLAERILREAEREGLTSKVLGVA